MPGRPLSGKPLSGRPLRGRGLERGLGLSHGQGGGSLLSQVQGLFQSGAVDGALYDISQLNTLFSDRSATPSTPASVDGVVGTILDMSGNDNHMIAPSDGARATLRQSGDYYYLEFSATHYYAADGISFSQSDTVFCAFRADVSATQYFIGSRFSSPRQRFSRSTGGLLRAGAINDTFASQSVSNGNDYVVQFEMNGSSSVCRKNGADGPAFNPGSSSINGVQLGASEGSGGWRSRIYGAGVINGVLTDAQKTTVDSWLASISGVTL